MDSRLVIDFNGANMEFVLCPAAQEFIARRVRDYLAGKHGKPYLRGIAA